MGNICFGIRPSVLDQARANEDEKTDLKNKNKEKNKNKAGKKDDPPLSTPQPPVHIPPSPRKETLPQKPSTPPARSVTPPPARPITSPPARPVTPPPARPITPPPARPITPPPARPITPPPARPITPPAPAQIWVNPAPASPRVHMQELPETGDSTKDVATVKRAIIAEMFKSNEGGSGYVKKDHLRRILGIMHIDDRDVLEFLWKRYDRDYNGVLDFEEFLEMMLAVIDIKKSFETADRNHDKSINGTEILSVLETLHITLTAHTIRVLMDLFDKDHSGGVEFNEFLPLSIYLNELIYQFKKFNTRTPEDTKWLKPLLGAHHDEDSDVAKELRKLLLDGREPSIDDFVRVIVTAANYNDFRDNVKLKVPQITKVRRPKQAKPLKKKELAKPAIEPQGLLHDHDHHEGLFCDPDFPTDRSILPQRAKANIVWKRPREINPNAQLFVDGVEEGDVIQGSLGDCWFLGALAVVAAITTNYIEHIFVKARPEIGYYCCQFYKNGKLVNVEVDDRLPCYPSGQLYFASCKDPSEFWVPIVEKAFAKLHGSYESLEGGSISDALKDLTGGGIEILRWKDEDKAGVWEIIRSNSKKNYLMGCSIDNNNAEAESKLPCGLLVNHAYSILKCKEIDGIKFLRIRNPWGEGEWTGAWADTAEEWTEEWKNKEFFRKYTFDNDGSFFMRFEDYIQYFNRIYVLRDVTASTKESWAKHTFEGEWKGNTASGCKNNPFWLNNPQFGIETTEPNTKIFINLSQPDLRYALKKNPEMIKSMHKEYETVGLYLLKTNALDYKKINFQETDKAGVSPFTDLRDLSFEFDCATPDTYVLLPCTYYANKEVTFHLSLYANKPVVVRELPAKACQSKEGEWKMGVTAGGCANYRSTTWMSNPQYLLRCSAAGRVVIMLSQAPKRPLEPIGIYVFAAQSESRLDAPDRPLLKPREISDEASVSETLTVDGNESYIIMPTTFDPAETSFTLTVVSDKIDVFRQL